MPQYILKHYVGELAGISSRALVAEFMFDAADAMEAIFTAQGQLNTIGFRRKGDVASLWDEDGKNIWERVANV